MRAVTLAHLLGWASMAGAQGPAEILRAESTAKSLNDLPATHRALSLGGDGWSSLASLTTQSFGGDNSLVFSLIGSVWVDPDEWSDLLEGRSSRIRVLAVDGERLSEAAFAPDADRVPIFSERWLERGGFGEWTPRPRIGRESFGRVFEEFRRARTSQAQTTTLVILGQLADAARRYAADHKGRLPKADSTEVAKRILQPYVRIQNLWRTENPKGGRVLYNTALSGKKLDALKPPGSIPLIWEETAWSDGTRAVTFLDGTAKRLGRASWDAMWKAKLGRRAAVAKRR